MRHPLGGYSNRCFVCYGVNMDFCQELMIPPLQTNFEKEAGLNEDKFIMETFFFIWFFS